MSSRPELKLAHCDHQAAKYACQKWHFTGSAPRGKYVRYGVWEDGRFRGVVLFGAGASPQIGRSIGLNQSTCCEMVRLALGPHRTPVSRILSIAVRLLRKHSPGIRCINTFADPSYGHHGGVYQAAGWLFLGVQKLRAHIRICGRVYHWRNVESKYGTHAIKWLQEHIDPAATWEGWGYRLKYVLPLDEDVRGRLQPLTKPYLKPVDTEQYRKVH